MDYGPSLSEEKEYVQQLQQAVNGIAQGAQQAAHAFLLAQMRWETQEIKEVEAEIRAHRASF